MVCSVVWVNLVGFAVCARLKIVLWILGCYYGVFSLAKVGIRTMLRLGLVCVVSGLALVVPWTSFTVLCSYRIIVFVIKTDFLSVQAGCLLSRQVTAASRWPFDCMVAVLAPTSVK